MQGQSLKSKSIKGMAWTSIHKFTSMGAQFISGVILARLLSPDDYGCVGMLSIFLSIATTIIDSGFSLAIVQKKNPSQDDYSTVFYWNLFLSVLMYLVLFASAPAIASFYRMPILSSVLRVQGVILVFNAIRSIQYSMAVKAFSFKKITIIMLSSQIIGICATIAMAYKGFGVWSLVAMNVIISVLPAAAFWITSKWKPSLVFSKQSFRELFGFGFFVFLSRLLDSFCDNVQGLLIGRFYTPATMGYYSKAQGTSQLASTSISQILTQVTLPVCVELQDDKKKMVSVLSRLSKSVSFVSFPLMGLLALVADMIFVVLYSEKWLPSVPYFRIFCLAGVAVSMVNIGSGAILAVGESKLSFRWNVIKRFFGLAMIGAGMYFFGMNGLLVGMVMIAWFNYLVNSVLMAKQVGYTIKMQLRDLLPVILATAGALALSYFIAQIFNANLYIDGVIKTVLFIGSYLFASYLLRNDSLQYYLEVAKLAIAKYIRNE